MEESYKGGAYEKLIGNNRDNDKDKDKDKKKMSEERMQYVKYFVLCFCTFLAVLMISYGDAMMSNNLLIYREVNMPYQEFEFCANTGMVDEIRYTSNTKSFRFYLKDNMANVLLNTNLLRESTNTFLAEQICVIETLGFDVESNVPSSYWLPTVEYLDTVESYISKETLEDINEIWSEGYSIVFATTYPNYDEFEHEMLQMGINFVTVDGMSQGDVLKWALTIIPTVFLLYFMVRMMKNFNPDKYGLKETDLTPVIPEKGFDAIGGHWETKKELQNIIDLINNRDISPENAQYIPKGYLLTGPPGTGKTALARAIAHETKCKFLYVCASDFIRLYVGQGAANVRKLMDIARKNAPCIIFLDEIDSLGTRGGDKGHSENDQTLNTLLTEIDGFKSNKDIIFIGATNFEEKVDPALVRAGRLERKITINLPEYGERIEILNIYLKHIKCDDTVDVKLLAEQTPGFSGADLENLVKTAKLETIINKTELVTSKDFDEAFFKIVMKGNKRTRIDPELKEKRGIIAYHESGHTLAHWLFEGNIPSKVTIIPSTSGAGGVTISVPAESLLKTKRYLKNSIKVLYGGRIAEEYLLKDEDEITIGAQQDIKEATKILYDLVNYYGMDGQLINYSMLEIQNNNIERMEPLAKSLYEEAKTEIFKNGELLERLANELLKYETLNKHEIEAIIEGKDISDIMTLDNATASDTTADSDQDDNQSSNQDGIILDKNLDEETDAMAGIMAGVLKDIMAGMLTANIMPNTNKDKDTVDETDNTTYTEEIIDDTTESTEDTENIEGQE